jgi:hypothetical protein
MKCYCASKNFTPPSKHTLNKASIRLRFLPGQRAACQGTIQTNPLPRVISVPGDHILRVQQSIEQCKYALAGS